MEHPHFTAAVSLVQKLQAAGHPAYFAGGWVRDMLLGRPSEDIDIATGARPEQVRALFRKTIAVGEAFGVIVVLMDGHSFEVATFRSDEGSGDGRRPEKIHYSTAQEDAQRRDFTVNGLFYDPLHQQVLDYVGGKEDLAARLIRTIGDPKARFQEDRLRMVRAVRFSALLDFEIVPETAAAIQQYAPELFPAVSMERIWQELRKMAANPHLDRALTLLRDLGLLSQIFPALSQLNCACLPPQMPPIALLPLLFPNATSLEYEALCRYLKTSRDDLRWLTEYASIRDLHASGNKDLAAWAYAYALPESERQLTLLAYLTDSSILAEHQVRRAQLQPHIVRLRERKPLVTAEMLIKQGVSPGPEMGKLLRRAEQLAILHNLSNADQVLELLLDDKK